MMDHFDELSPEDGSVVDALMECGFDLESLDAPTLKFRRRAEAVCGLLATIDLYPVEDADDTLVHATMARVDRYEREREDRMHIDSGSSRVLRHRAFRLPDFISVAAALLICAGIGLPAFNALRNHAIDIGCDSNLRLVSQGLSSYAQSHQDRVPVQTAGMFGGFDSMPQWLDLRPIVDQGYCDHGHVNCPGHQGEAEKTSNPVRSLSFQIYVPSEINSWGRQGTLVILGDRNPVLEQGPQTSSLANSLNHNSRGQNLLLYDGSTQWIKLPLLDSGDNIWLQNRHGKAADGDVWLVH